MKSGGGGFCPGLLLLGLDLLLLCIIMFRPTRTSLKNQYDLSLDPTSHMDPVVLIGQSSVIKFCIVGPLKVTSLHCTKLGPVTFMCQNCARIRLIKVGCIEGFAYELDHCPARLL